MRADPDRRQDVTDLLANRRNIGFVFQNYALFPHLTVFENVAYGLRVQGRDEAEIGRRSARCWSWSAWPDMTASSRTSCRAASSSGWRWPAPSCSARGSCCSTSRSVTWTPSSGSRCARDPQLQKRLGITAVYVTHDQEEAMAISDRIAVMDRGPIVQEGTAQALYHRPATEFVAQFIGRTNLLEGRVVSAGEVEIEGVRVAFATGVAAGERCGWSCGPK